MASAANPYRAPAAAVADAAEEFQPVNIYSVSGRIGRARYIAYSLGIFMLMGIVISVSAPVLMAIGLGGAIIGVVIALYVGLFVWMFMLTIQRAHDFNTTGWLSILMLIPLLNLIFWFIPGTGGANRWGARTPPNTVLVLIGAWIVPILFILGIVSAIVLPAYQDYAKRAQERQTQKK